jgi:hypothetical protein
MRIGLALDVSSSAAPGVYEATLDYNYASTMALGGLETFTRGSTAGYFNSSGVLTSAATNAARFDYDPASARTNLALRSAQQDVSGVWTAAQVTVTADTVTDPLGTTTADTFTENSVALSRGTAQTVTIASNVSQTFSVYAKAGTRSWLRLMLTIGADSVICWFNLGTGAVGSTTTEGTGSSPAGAITDAGSGWYRCALTGIPSSVNSGSIGAYIRMATQDNEFSYQGNGVGTLHVWGAQLELGSSATAYIATTTATVTTYTPRGLLVEPTATNLCLQSQVLGTTWTTTRASVTSNVAVAPDGTTTADKIVEDNTVTNSHLLAQALALSNTTTYTVSAYVKAAERTSIRVLLKDNVTGTNSFSAIFDLALGTVNSTAAAGTGTIAASSITAINNGWYRITMTGIPYTSGTAAAVNISVVQGAATTTYTGDNASGIYVWGVQIEAGTFASSYVPTTTTSVARSADVCTITPLGSWFNASTGTLIGEWVVQGVKATGVQTVVSIDDGTTANRVSIFATNASGQPQGSLTVTTTKLTAFRVAVAVALTTEKMAVTWDASGSRAYLNGAVLDTGTGGALVVTQMRIGHRTTDQLNGWLRRVRCYDKRVPNVNLQTLTT